MKKVLFALLIILTSNSSIAGRTGNTKITALIVKPTWIEFYTESEGGCGTNPNRWHLRLEHPNFDAMYSGLLASKASGKGVDIVGKNVCGVAEDVDWAYILK